MDTARCVTAIRFELLRNDPMSAMEITPSDNAAGSGVDRQAQNVAPASRFASDDPVTSSQIRGPHPTDAVALSYTHRLATIDTTRPSIDLNAIAVNR